jgi:hypothetical protein
MRKLLVLSTSATVVSTLPRDLICRHDPPVADRG